MHPIWNVPVPGAGRPDKLVLFDHFLGSSVSATADAANWLITVPGTADAVALSDGIIGGAVLITSASDAGEAGIDTNGGGFSIPTSDKSLYFECRFKVADADIAAGEVFVGLGSVADVAPIASDANKIGFSRATTDATIFWTTGDTLTTTGKDLSDATWVTVAFRINGGKAIYYVDLEDGTGATKVGETTTLAATTTVLSPKVFVAFSDGSQTVLVDYILVVQDI